MIKTPPYPVCASEIPPSRLNGVVAFGPSSEAPARDLAGLHMRILPTSPLCAYGRPLLEEFYYTLLPRDGLIVGVISYVDGRPAGLAVGATDSVGFMRRAIRNHWPLIMRLLLASLARNPRRVAELFRAMIIMGRQKEEPCTGLVGQKLTLGVLPEYCTREFKERTGRHVAHEVSTGLMVEFEKAGVPLVRTFIERGNHRSLSRAMRRGWRIRREHVPGWKVPHVELVADPGEYVRLNEHES